MNRGIGKVTSKCNVPHSFESFFLWLNIWEKFREIEDDMQIEQSADKFKEF